MGIPTRTPVTTPAPKRPNQISPVVIPPTRGMVEHAGQTFGKLLGLKKEQTAEITAFASKSAMTAWALVDYAHFLVRCMGADEKLRVDENNRPLYRGRIEAFERAMSEAETKDLEPVRKADAQAKVQAKAEVEANTAKTEALLADEAKDAEAQAKAQAKAKEARAEVLRARQAKTEALAEVFRLAKLGLLKGIPEGTTVPLSNAERRVVIDTLAPAFGAPEGTPLEGEVGGVIIGKRGSYQRFALNLIRTFLGDETYETEFKAQLAAARSSATTETDEDDDVAAAS